MALKGVMYVFVYLFIITSDYMMEPSLPAAALYFKHGNKGLCRLCGYCSARDFYLHFSKKERMSNNKIIIIMVSRDGREAFE